MTMGQIMETKLKRKPGRPRKYLPEDEHTYEEDEVQIRNREAVKRYKEAHLEEWKAYQREYQRRWRERNQDKLSKIYADHIQRKKQHKLQTPNDQPKEDVQ